MDTTRPKITFGVVDERYLLCISPAATEGKGNHDFLAIELCGFGGFQMDLRPPTINLAPEWPPFNQK
jgi:hypothetical protein